MILVVEIINFQDYTPEAELLQLLDSISEKFPDITMRWLYSYQKHKAGDARETIGKSVEGRQLGGIVIGQGVRQGRPLLRPQVILAHYVDLRLRHHDAVMLNSTGEVCGQYSRGWGGGTRDATWVGKVGNLNNLKLRLLAYCLLRNLGPSLQSIDLYR